MEASHIRIVSNVQAVFSPLYEERYELSLLTSRIPAGFPSPATDYAEEPLDLNRHLIRHSVATFFVRVQGDSMIGAHIFDGDLLIVDCAEEVRGNHIVLAQIGGETYPGSQGRGFHSFVCQTVVHRSGNDYADNHHCPSHHAAADDAFLFAGILGNFSHLTVVVFKILHRLLSPFEMER